MGRTGSEDDGYGGGAGGGGGGGGGRHGYERAAADECSAVAQCSSTSKRVQMRKYCDMDYVYLITVLGKERADRKWTVFRCVKSLD